MDLLRGEPGSSTETCVTPTIVRKEVTGVEAGRVSHIKEEDQEPTTIPKIKTETEVSGVPVVCVCIFLIAVSRIACPYISLSL